MLILTKMMRLLTIFCWWHFWNVDDLVSKPSHQYRGYQTYMFSLSWDAGLGTGRPQCPHWPIGSEFFFSTFSNIILNSCIVIFEEDLRTTLKTLTTFLGTYTSCSRDWSTFLDGWPHSFVNIQIVTYLKTLFLIWIPHVTPTYIVFRHPTIFVIYRLPLKKLEFLSFFHLVFK